MATSNPPFTLRSMAGLPSDPPDLAASLVVVIDAQEEYSSRGALELPGLVPALERIGRVLSAARDTGAPVVHVAHRGPTGGLFDPERGGRILGPARPVHGEPVVHKTLPNAFAKTELMDHLTGPERRPLILVGFMTHMCVSSTARAALDLGLSTTVLSDATASRDLPAANGAETVAAATVHEAALAALADRFSIISHSDAVVAGC